MPASVMAAVPPGLDARVRGLDVRMRADDRRDAAVEPAGERDLLARRLGVNVDEDHRRLLPCLLDELVDHLEHRDGGREEERAHHVDHSDLRPVLGGGHRQPAAGRELGEVRGPDHPLGVGEVGVDLGTPPGVVAERDHVCTRGKDPRGEFRA